MITSFRAWLFEQQHREDPVGDLARDAFADRLESAANTPGDYKARLLDLGASESAMGALDRAAQEWRRAHGQC